MWPKDSSTRPSPHDHLPVHALKGPHSEPRHPRTCLPEGVGGRYSVDCNETGIVGKRSGTLHGLGPV